MAARLSGRDPDERLQVNLSDVAVFDDKMWRYPDFLFRAIAAYDVLGSAALPPGDLEFPG